MEKKKIILLASLCLFCLTITAQKDSIVKKGMIRGQGNLSGGYIFQSKKFASYISGNAEYYINEGFSLVGDVWISFDIANKDEIGLRKNYSTFAGLNYHPVRYSRWDPYIGFSAGAGIITSNFYQDTLIRESPVQFSPLVGVTAGLNYYVGSIFHFFVQCKFVAGGSNSSQYGRTYLEELKLSGGLGWNISTRRKKKK
jgi:hypothetical protein